MQLHLQTTAVATVWQGGQVNLIQFKQFPRIISLFKWTQNSSPLCPIHYRDSTPESCFPSSTMIIFNFASAVPIRSFFFVDTTSMEKNSPNRRWLVLQRERLLSVCTWWWLAEVIQTWVINSTTTTKWPRTVVHLQQINSTAALGRLKPVHLFLIRTTTTEREREGEKEKRTQTWAMCCIWIE